MCVCVCVCLCVCVCILKSLRNGAATVFVNNIIYDNWTTPTLYILIFKIIPVFQPRKIHDFIQSNRQFHLVA